jgi:cAMP-binding proteins - catabolite gene activator and regulatory subunit of cAMP-dependent protein kinases
MQEQILLKHFLRNIRLDSYPQQIHLFSQLFERKHLKKDEYFIREGKINYDIAFMLEGVMRLYIIDEDGNETNLRFIKENDLFSGGYAFGQKAIVNLQCLEDCTVFVARGCDFITITSHLHSVARSYNSMLDCLFKKSMLRLSSYIKLNGKERYKLFLKDYPGLANRIPLFHIANHLGISQVQLSRIRAEIAKSDNLD